MGEATWSATPTPISPGPTTPWRVQGTPIYDVGRQLAQEAGRRQARAAPGAMALPPTILAPETPRLPTFNPTEDKVLEWMQAQRQQHPPSSQIQGRPVLGPTPFSGMGRVVSHPSDAIRSKAAWGHLVANPAPVAGWAACAGDSTCAARSHPHPCLAGLVPNSALQAGQFHNPWERPAESGVLQMNPQGGLDKVGAPPPRGHSYR